MHNTRQSRMHLPIEKKFDKIAVRVVFDEIAKISKPFMKKKQTAINFETLNNCNTKTHDLLTQLCNKTINFLI